MLDKSKLKKALVFALMIGILLPLNTEIVYASGLNSGFGDAFVALFNEYKIHLIGFLGIGILTSILAFIVNFMKLGTHSTNPWQRSQVIKELIVIGICTALLGGISLVFSVLYGIFA